MSEYRDALVTAQGRVARLEALAKERGLPRASNRGRKIGIGAFAVAVASAVVYVGVRAWRESIAPTVQVDVVKKSAPPPTAPIPPHDIEWYEPADSWNPIRGPQEAWWQGKHLIVGLLWRRGERTNALYVGAFDFDTLTKRWVAGPFDGEWTGEDDERFHVAVSGASVIVTDAAGLIRVFSVETGLLVGKRDMPRGTWGLCPTVRGPKKWMVGFGAHQDANTVRGLFPWELGRNKPYYFDPELLSLTPAPNAPPEGTWCGAADFCDSVRKDGCHDEERRWQYGNRFVRVEPDAGRSIVTGWTRDTKGVAIERWASPTGAKEGFATMAMGEQHFFQGYVENGKQVIIALDLDTGKSHFMKDISKSPGARLRLLKWISPDRLFALYDDEMLVFDPNGERVGKVSATP